MVERPYGQPAGGLRPEPTAFSQPVGAHQAQISDIVRRRFGSLHDKPCSRAEVLTCARWECQVRDRCQYLPTALSIVSDQPQGET